MITATCRTCHQDWTVDYVTLIGITGTLEALLKAPCGHGHFVGKRPPGDRGLQEWLEGIRDATQWHESDFMWTWHGPEYAAAEAAQDRYEEDHPYPDWDPWDPPALRMTCACGTALTLTGIVDDILGAGWSELCYTCGMEYWVTDVGESHAYSQGRLRRYKEAVKAWTTAHPPAPLAVPVEHLQERGGNHE